MRKTSLWAPYSFVAVLAISCLLSGCASMKGMFSGKAKGEEVHKGYNCYINGTVMEVKNIHNNVKFLGPTVAPEKKMSCDLVIKTDRNEVHVIPNAMLFAVNESTAVAKDSYVECAEASVGRRVTIHKHEKEVIGVDPKPNPYLEAISSQ